MLNDSQCVYELNIESCYDGYIYHFGKFNFTHTEFPFLKITNTLHTSTHPELNSQNIYRALGEMQIEYSHNNDAFIPHKTS